MLDDGLQEGAGPPVVEEEQPLADAPKRHGPEFARPGSTLDDVVGKSCAHVMHEEVGEQVHRPALQHCTVHHRRGLHLWRMAQGAANRAEHRSTALRAWAW